MNSIICIAGPTASGKTALAVALAKELHELAAAKSAAAPQKAPAKTKNHELEVG